MLIAHASGIPGLGFITEKAIMIITMISGIGLMGLAFGRSINFGVQKIRESSSDGAETSKLQQFIFNAKIALSVFFHHPLDTSILLLKQLRENIIATLSQFAFNAKLFLNHPIDSTRYFLHSIYDYLKEIYDNQTPQQKAFYALLAIGIAITVTTATGGLSDILGYAVGGACFLLSAGLKAFPEFFAHPIDSIKQFGNYLAKLPTREKWILALTVVSLVLSILAFSVFTGGIPFAVCLGVSIACSVTTSIMKAYKKYQELKAARIETNPFTSNEAVAEAITNFLSSKKHGAVDATIAAKPEPAEVHKTDNDISLSTQPASAAAPDESRLSTPRAPSPHPSQDGLFSPRSRSRSSAESSPSSPQATSRQRSQSAPASPRFKRS
jgi:hypothetical protein